jgi:hypothetical protein
VKEPSFIVCFIEAILCHICCVIGVALYCVTFFVSWERYCIVSNLLFCRSGTVLCHI